MTREEGKRVGFEFFDHFPTVARGSDDGCDDCGEIIQSGYLEMECDCWLCAACFAKVPYEPDVETL